MKPAEAEARRKLPILRNPRYGGAAARATVSDAFTRAEADAAFVRISAWPQYRPTPLVRMPAAARQFDISELYCKDEGGRLGLQSFKALGAFYASVSIVSDLLATQTGETIGDAVLLSGSHAHLLGGIVLTSATDGNHGFSLASAARHMGCAARIYIPHGVSAGRAEALRREGAEVIRIDGIYEEAMDAAIAAARCEPGTFLVSDYATPEYEAVPRLCMAGYSVLMRELAEQLAGPPPTHVFAPAGCGGLAASIVTSARQLWGGDAPRVVIVEPTRAACVFASAAAGVPVRIDGDLDTIMGGLACAAPSSIAWPTLREGAFAFMQIEDEAAIGAMRFFARPAAETLPIVSGETGAAGLAALLSVHADRAAREALDITESSRVLVISCESATDPEVYRQLVGAEPVDMPGK